MSPTEMKVSNPDAVLSIEDAGKKAGAEGERKRLADLQAAFPDDPAYVAECQAKEGFTAIEAMAARYQLVHAQNKELKKENEKLAKVAAEKDPTVEFVASDKEGAAAVGDDVGLTVDDKDAKATELWNKNANLRATFHGGKGSFQALYRNDPQMALQVVEDSKPKK